MKPNLIRWSAPCRALLVPALLIAFALFAGMGETKAQGGPLERPQAWVDDELFDGVVVSATFEPFAEPFDELYTGGNGFLDGVPLISETRPGDIDYNGGRWHMNMLKEGVDPDKYADASSVEDLDLGDFMSTNVYFECPLLPRRGDR